MAAKTSPYGMFLAGQSALNSGRSIEAAKFFDQARSQTGDPMIAERAFTSALLSGDIQKAAALAPTGEDASEASKRLGKLVMAVDDIASGKGKEASALLANDGLAIPHKSAGALLAPWAAAMAGNVEGSLVRPQVRGDRLVDYFGQLGQAALFERAKRYDEAETDFKALTSGDSPSEMVVVAYGAFLERRDRRPDAIALYDKALANSPNSLGLAAAKARATTGKPAPPQPTIRQGAAQALLSPAATLVSAKQEQLALAYLRLVLYLDPQRDDAWLMLGDLPGLDSTRLGDGRSYPLRPLHGLVEYRRRRRRGRPRKVQRHRNGNRDRGNAGGYRHGQTETHRSGPFSRWRCVRWTTRRRRSLGRPGIKGVEPSAKGRRLGLLTRWRHRQLSKPLQIVVRHGLIPRLRAVLSSACARRTDARTPSFRCNP